MTPRLRVEIVDTTAALDSLRPEWDALYTRVTGGANPFLRWTWVRHWWRSVSQRQGFPRTRLHVVAMRDPEGQLQVVVPLFIGICQIGPLRFRALRLYGFHTTLTDIGTVLVAP